MIACQYAVDNKKVVKAKITEPDGTEEGKARAKEVVPVGLEFSFKWAVDKDTATLDDLRGDKADILKSHMEGKYEPK